MHGIVCGYHKKGGKQRCVSKVGLMKAYDTVNWEFLFTVIELMQFPSRFITWIKNGVCTAQFSLNLNGSLVGYFKSERGLRQGDPLSPYLFLLAMEVFPSLFDFKLQQHRFDHHPKCGILEITNIIFADDLFLLFAATTKAASLMKSVLDNFSRWSGLTPNAEKS